jgi:hypothetical protein
VASQTLKDAGGDIIEKRCRVILDLKVVINELTMEYVRKHVQWPAEQEETGWIAAERDNRLLLALIRNEQVLEKYLAHYITYEIEGDLEKDLIRKFDPGEVVEEILEPVIKELPADDVAYFEEIIREEVFLDCTYLMREAINIDWDRSELVKIFLVEEGEVEEKRADC